MYKKILVPLDGSQLAEAVLPHAEALAKTEGIYDTTLQALSLARDEKITPQAAAIRLATQRIEKIGSIRKVR